IFEPGAVTAAVEPLLPIATRIDEALLLVEPQRAGAHAKLLGEVADGEDLAGAGVPIEARHQRGQRVLGAAAGGPALRTGELGHRQSRLAQPDPADRVGAGRLVSPVYVNVKHKCVTGDLTRPRAGSWLRNGIPGRCLDGETQARHQAVHLAAPCVVL